MKTYRKEELAEILENHRSWLLGEAGGIRANLSGANLRGADLRGARVWGCTGNRREIKSIFITDTYPITYTAEVLQIGCERHKIEDWLEFDDERIAEMEGSKAIEFWREWKDTLRMLIEKSPAVPTGKEVNDE